MADRAPAPTPVSAAFPLQPGAYYARKEAEALRIHAAAQAHRARNRAHYLALAERSDDPALRWEILQDAGLLPPTTQIVALAPPPAGPSAPFSLNEFSALYRGGYRLNAGEADAA
ncbi:MAG: hypothetical protein KGJ05_03330 [Alphaproteobacteria bacterium]|nr:hypothetical protein [Alphaproteobacteria bacterium]MDE2341439.1 hypothetical protein [Alphaproteobacteria bacterium]